MLLSNISCFLWWTESHCVVLCHLMHFSTIAIVFYYTQSSLFPIKSENVCCARIVYEVIILSVVGNKTFCRVWKSTWSVFGTINCQWWRMWQHDHDCGAVQKTCSVQCTSRRVLFKLTSWTWNKTREKWKLVLFLSDSSNIDHMYVVCNSD